MASARFRRRLPIGAEIVPGGGVHFRIWAPKRRKVEAVIDPARGGGPQERIVFDREPAGYYSGFSETAGDGSTYRLRLDGEATLYPDPASRFQPEGPHGPSRVVDPHKFRWSDGSWQGARLPGQVV
jgi:maltooligosyltrehalose trehalohydrolase